MQAWNVYLNGKWLDTVFYGTTSDRFEVKRSLVDHDGYDPAITVRRNAVSFTLTGLAKDAIINTSTTQ